jgi:hypothetical protein
MLLSVRSLAPYLFFAAAASVATARDYRITVPAAGSARAGQVMTFPLPADIEQPVIVTDSSGRKLSVQIDDTGLASFVIARQPANTALTFTLAREATAPRNTITTARDGPRLDVSAEGQLLFAYWAGPRPLPDPGIDPAYLRSGFIHPVMSPAGVELTDSYPKDHRHHHGIWSPWTKTEFQGRTPDFWNMGQKKAKVEAERLVRHWSGPVHGGFIARHQFIDLSAPSPIVALHETWEVKAYDLPDAPRPARVFDLVITQTCATNDPLILPEYHYGGLGYRGPEAWNGKDRARFLTSEGITDRVAAHGTRARWCYIGGEVDGRLAGTAILGHPDNFRAPQPMRIHPNEPFFCYAPSQLGQWQISPGEPYVARYRFVAIDGAPDRELLEAYWAGYAQPAVAVVEPL